MCYTLLVDADEILYNCAFALEEQAYKVITPKGEWDFGVQYSKDEIILELGLKGKANELDYQLIAYKKPKGPASFAIQAVKMKLKELNSIGDVKLYLTSVDKSNFRYSISKTEGPKGLGYKAGRPPKPIYYNECREYLLKRGAEEVFGIEADDALGINQTDNTVVVHQDKDINRIAGKHYNWKTNERYIVEQPGYIGLKEMTEGRKKIVGGGNIWFFAQMLLGDRTDNVPSVTSGYGDVKVCKLLVNCLTEHNAYDIVREHYEKHHPDNWKERMDEIADLVYIMDSNKITGRQYLEQF